MMVIEGRQATESIKQWVYRTLRHAIMTGRFRPGHPLTINGLAEMLDVSAMPVREALQFLVADGAIELLDNRRVRVPLIDPDKFDEILSARIALETVAAERALAHIDFIRLAHLQHLDRLVDEAYGRGDIEGGIAANFDFHRCLYEARSSAVLLPLIESLWLRLGPFMRLAAENLHEHYLVDRHAEALEAIRTEDPAALKAAIAADIQDGAGDIGRAQFLETAAQEFAGTHRS
ncbi:GntR family transcriptional regulator [Mycoplana rhizolycopersici]|nr:GntR family transcriptional regulator [Rhizobium rhizolycopersici]